MSTLSFERRVDVERGIGDEERPRIVGTIDNEDMAHAPDRAKLLFADNRAHEFVRMQAALHQRLDLAVTGERNGLGRRRVAVLGGHDLVPGEVELRGFRRGADFGLGTDQHRHDKIFLASLDGARKRNLIHRVHNRGAQRRQPLRLANEVLVMVAFHLRHLLLQARNDAVSSRGDSQRQRRKSRELLRRTAQQRFDNAAGAPFADNDGIRVLFVRDADDCLRDPSGP